MALTARHDLSVWRNDDNAWEYQLKVRGADLTNAGLAMQVRQGPDRPGAPLIDLLGTTNGNAQGLRVAGVSTVDGLPETDLRIRINKSTLQGLPYLGGVGDPSPFEYALVLSGITRMVGKFIVLPHTYGSDGAPATRSVSGEGSSTGVPLAGATLTISGTETTVLNLDGADLLAPVVAQANEQAAVAKVITETLVGAPAATPIGGNANDLLANAPAGSTGASFDLLITATNTGQSFLETAPGFRRRIARDGGGNDTLAGDLPQGKIVTLTYSAGGGSFILTGPPRDVDGVDELLEPVKPLDPAKPWGTVTYANGGTGGRTTTTITKYVTVVGSSNAYPDYVEASRIPATVAAAALNDSFPGSGLVFEADNRSAPGAPMASMASQLDASAAFTAGNTAFVLTMFGMNDARTLFYHAQGGIMAQLAALEAGIRKVRAKGAEPVLNTIFPPDPRGSAIALDPNWFADTTDMGNGVSGATSEMNFPAYHAAPVSPQNHMEPRLNQLLEVRDWTGHNDPAKNRTGYKRIWHVNHLVRLLAARYNCALLDFEWASYRNAIETVTNLGAGLDTYYDSGNPLHPNMPLYDAAVTPVIKQWAAAVAAGRTDRRVFTGAA
ncbi:GDSL-like Lipase/Acylhydrolase family protein [Sphingomonas sp. OV641]|uniref:hypothetical protein n=1 Tax=Sphingomonas sp. OV641 TaxID=1881068 RepID=UPI0008C8B7B3|nr:hypothetical protein [Sphingomonas sp. OV641]SEJ02990.1 GDSL-like Lipase/Acylhydrolase family protein [Sphingomonas sp. OV641]